MVRAIVHVQNIRNKRMMYLHIFPYKQARWLLLHVPPRLSQPCRGTFSTTQSHTMHILSTRRLLIDRARGLQSTAFHHDYALQQRLARVLAARHCHAEATGQHGVVRRVGLETGAGMAQHLPWIGEEMEFLTGVGCGAMD